MKRIEWAVFFSGIALVLFHCGLSLSGGSGTETTGIVGYAIDSTGRPISGAYVNLRRTDFLDTARIALGKSSVYAANAITDSVGKFYIREVDTGSYNVEINDGRQNAIAVKCNVSRNDSLFEITQCILRPTGTVSGRIIQSAATDPTKFSIFIYGFARHFIVSDINGNYSISDLPEGAFSFKIIPNTPIYAPTDVPEISIVSGENKELSPMEMPKSSDEIHITDSLILRAILDSNGLQNVPVRKVVKIDSLWPRHIHVLLLDYDIRKDFPQIHSLTSRIGELTELREIHAKDNLLEALPSNICKLRHLRRLILKFNRLSTLPTEFGELDSLEELDISYNSLAFLPAEIGRLTSLVKLWAGGSRIQFTSIPAEIGRCSRLTYLDLSQGSFETLPEEIGDLNNLEFLDVQANFIKSLPSTITNLRPVNKHLINVTGNWLCENVPREIQNWLDTFSFSSPGNYDEWRMYQCKNNGAYNCIPREEWDK